MPGDSQMINIPSLLYENTGYTRQVHSLQSWEVCFGTAEPLSYFFTNYTSSPSAVPQHLLEVLPAE